MNFHLDLDSSPVAQLPSEIVSEIFIHCLPLYPKCPPLLGTDSTSPTALSQICGLWRAIAHATPQLWRGIALNPEYTRSRTLDSQEDVVRDWLQRSGTVPLSVVIPVFTPGYKLLLAQRHRWQYAAIHVPDGAERIPYLDGDMPVLLDFVMRHYDHDLRSLVGPRFDAPMLRMAAFDLQLNVYPAITHAMNWGNLARLALKDVSLASTYEILKQSNPVACNLRISGTSESWDDVVDAPSEVSLPRLHLLLLDVPGRIPDGLPQFLKTLRTPALKRLRIDEDYFPRETPDETQRFAAGLALSLGCDLEYLHVKYAKLSLETYKAIFPGVEYLSTSASGGPFDEAVWGHWDLFALCVG
ncbi:F-box domain-containing protein [Mycena kentingensis (nom. inval.)]|nr:F-box domain-containing protein [Mycena kentingensis (nom. inval.)]